jgi:hypothetical protein
MSDMPYRLSNFAKPQFADSAFYKTDDKSDKTPAPLRGLIEQRLELGRLSQVLRWNGSPSMPKGLPPSDLDKPVLLNLGAPDPILSDP